nr:MAG TPA: hypothetical protein [Caudoviricetes sp.]
MTKFFLYFLRWHLSTLVMMPIMPTYRLGLR